MTEIRDPAIARLLAEARVQYVGTVPAKVTEVRTLLERQAWEDARRAAHKLRGSSGTYGFAELSVALGEIEEQLLQAGGPPDAAGLRRLLGLVEAASALAERAAAASEVA